MENAALLPGVPRCAQVCLVCPGGPGAGPASAWRLSLQRFRASYCQALELVGKGLSTVMMKQGLWFRQKLWRTPPASGTVSALGGPSLEWMGSSTPCHLSHGGWIGASCTRASVCCLGLGPVLPTGHPSTIVTPPPPPYRAGSQGGWCWPLSQGLEILPSLEIFHLSVSSPALSPQGVILQAPPRGPLASSWVWPARTTQERRGAQGGPTTLPTSFHVAHLVCVPSWFPWGQRTFMSPCWFMSQDPLLLPCLFIKCSYNYPRWKVLSLSW